MGLKYMKFRIIFQEFKVFEITYGYSSGFALRISIEKAIREQMLRNHILITVKAVGSGHLRCQIFCLL